MEQVGTVLVDFGTGLLVDIAVHVAADVAAHIDDLDPGARALRRLLCDGQAEQARVCGAGRAVTLPFDDSRCSPRRI